MYFKDCASQSLNIGQHAYLFLETSFWGLVGHSRWLAVCLEMKTGERLVVVDNEDIFWEEGRVSQVGIVDRCDELWRYVQVLGERDRRLQLSESLAD